MRIENGKAIYETVTCWSCKGTGKFRFNHPCPNSGKTMRQGCPICGKTRKADHGWFPNEQENDCDVCMGTGNLLENSCSSSPKGFLAQFPWKVYRSNRPQTAREALLGIGICSVTDCGRWKERTDEDLINEHINESSQYTKVINRENVPCSEIAIFCNENGYSVIGVWE
jgi:hypothetical protein